MHNAHCKMQNNDPKEASGVSVSLADFREAVIRYGEFVLTDASAANQYYDRFIGALRKLSGAGDEGMLALTSLLDDRDLGVRATAACYLMNYRTEAAQRVLREAAGMQDRAIGLLAVATLKRWEKGYYLDPNTGKETNQ